MSLSLVGNRGNMVTDTVADLLTRIRNAQMAGHKTVVIPGSSLCRNILDVMQQEGYVNGVEDEEDAKGFKQYKVKLKFYDDGSPLLTSLKRVSKPGCRVYSRVQDLDRVKSGLGTALISTSQGVLTDKEAKERNIGGEVLAIIG